MKEFRLVDKMVYALSLFLFTYYIILKGKFLLNNFRSDIMGIDINNKAVKLYDRPTILRKFLDLRLLADSNKQEGGLYTEHSPQLIRGIISCKDGVYLIRHVATSLTKSEYLSYDQMCKQISSSSASEKDGTTVYALDKNSDASVFEFCGIHFEGDKPVKNKSGRIYKGIEEFLLVTEGGFNTSFIRSDNAFMGKLAKYCSNLVNSGEKQTVCGLRRLYGVCSFMFERALVGDYKNAFDKAIKEHCKQSINYRHLVDIFGPKGEKAPEGDIIKELRNNSGKRGDFGEIRPGKDTFVDFCTKVNFARLFPNWGTFDIQGECEKGAGSDSTTLTSKFYLQDALPSEENPDGGVLFRHFKDVSDMLAERYAQRQAVEQNQTLYEGLVTALVDGVPEVLDAIDTLQFVSDNMLYSLGSAQCFATYLTQVEMTTLDDNVEYNNMVGVFNKKAEKFKAKGYPALFNALENVKLVNIIKSVYCKRIDNKYTTTNLKNGKKYTLSFSADFVKKENDSNTGALLNKYSLGNNVNNMLVLLKNFKKIIMGYDYNNDKFKTTYTSLATICKHIMNYADGLTPTIRGKDFYPILDDRFINEDALQSKCRSVFSNAELMKWYNSYIQGALNVGIFAAKSGSGEVDMKAYNTPWLCRIRSNGNLNYLGALTCGFNKVDEVDNWMNLEVSKNLDTNLKALDYEHMLAFFMWDMSVCDVLFEYAYLYCALLWMFEFKYTYKDNMGNFNDTFKRFYNFGENFDIVFSPKYLADLAVRFGVNTKDFMDILKDFSDIFVNNYHGETINNISIHNETFWKNREERLNALGMSILQYSSFATEFYFPLLRLVLCEK